MYTWMDIRIERCESIGIVVTERVIEEFLVSLALSEISHHSLHSYTGRMLLISFNHLYTELITARRE